MKKNRNLYIISLVILNIILDQISKFWIRNNVMYREDIQIISDYFIITNVENSGAFLGLGSDFPPIVKNILLLALPVLVLISVLVYVFKDKSCREFRRLRSSIGKGPGNSKLPVVSGFTESLIP